MFRLESESNKTVPFYQYAPIENKNNEGRPMRQPLLLRPETIGIDFLNLVSPIAKKPQQHQEQVQEVKIQCQRAHYSQLLGIIY